jgi:hypothetical protein
MWIAILALSFCRASLCQQALKQGQLHFSAEDQRFQRETSIPLEVLNLLKANTFVQSVLSDRGIAENELPTTWFTASEVDLGAQNQHDYVIMGIRDLRGANVAPFWIVSEAAGTAKVILYSPAHDLIIGTQRMNGYKVIELVSMTAGHVSKTWLRFNGSVYDDYRHSNTKLP